MNYKVAIFDGYWYGVNINMKRRITTLSRVLGGALLFPLLAQARPSQLLAPARIRAIRLAPSLQWKARFGLGANATPVWGDVDSDGRLDVIAPAVNGVKKGAALVRLAANGALVWSAALPEVPSAGPTLGDIDRDGALDILVAVAGQLRCYDLRGVEKWRFTVGKPIESFPTIADLDLDGKNEVIFGANDNLLRCLDATGTLKWQFETRSWIVRGVAVGQLIGDEKPEIVFGSMDSHLYCLDYSGKEQWNFEAGDWVASSPVIGDVDKNGFNDVVLSSDDGNVYCVNRYGSKKWEAQYSGPEARVQPYLALGDVDGDGQLETVLSTKAGQLSVYNSSGEVRTNESYGPIEGAPVLADLNGDGRQDIIFSSSDGYLRAVTLEGRQQFAISLGGSAVSSPTIGDFDGDGKWEIYAANLMQGAGFLYGFEINAVGGKAVWPTLKGDPYRTGFVPNAADYGAKATRGDLATVWEPFGASYRPTSKVQKPRRLRVTLLALDDARGNHDGALDPGETAWVRVKVENLGQGASYDNLLRLNLGKSFLSLDRSSAYLGWIAPGATKTAVFRLSAPVLSRILEIANSDDPEAPPTLAQLALPNRVPPKRKIRRVKITSKRDLPPQTLYMEVLESGVSAAIARANVFGVPALPPDLRIAQTQVLDGKTSLTNGNGNGRLDAGENVILRLLVVNKNLTTASRVKASLTSRSSDILTATNRAVFADVVPGGGRRLDFSLRVAKAPKNKIGVLRLFTLSKTTGVTQVDKFQDIKLPIGGKVGDVTPPQIVLENPRTAIFSTRSAQITIRGRVLDASPIVRLSFERRDQRMLPGNRFAFYRVLKVGENVFPLAATDRAGNTTQKFVRVIRKP
jgi:FG-GAP-like repeat/PQQ-like domain